HEDWSGRQQPAPPSPDTTCYATIRETPGTSIRATTSEATFHPGGVSLTLQLAPARFRLPRGLVREVDPGRLDLGVLVEGMERLVAAVAGLLVATEGGGHVATVPVVDPDAAGAQAAGDAVGTGEVGGPD